MLYHKQVYWPKFNEPKGVQQLRPSLHAQKACENDRYGYINLPNTINWNNAQVFEVAIENGGWRKVAVRIPYSNNPKFDLCMVISKDCVVITAWLNRRSDKHQTLDYAKYATRI